MGQVLEQSFCLDGFTQKNGADGRSKSFGFGRNVNFGMDTADITRRIEHLTSGVL